MPAQIAPIWVRQGLILDPGLPGPGWSPHCQMPTPWRLNDTTLRLFYCSRDARNRSHVFRADLSATSPWHLHGQSDGPVLAPGLPGSFDAAGVMPTALVQREDALWMYYIGWTQRTDVPYHNAIGIARSLDGGHSFERFLPGPVLGTSVNEPYFCGTCDVARVGTRWVMWYMSTTEWRLSDGRREPRYHLKQAYSDDGIHWDHGRDVAVDYLNDNEGGIARATVLRRDKHWWMWFCYRGVSGYRGTGPAGYRIGVARSDDGLSWQRLPGQKIFDANPKQGDFDQFMQCYPAVFRTEQGDFLFYNGSDFGQTGIGIARSRADEAVR